MEFVVSNALRLGGRSMALAMALVVGVGLEQLIIFFNTREMKKRL